MTIMHSAEVRWIIPGTVSENIKKWFKKDPNCRMEKTRIDYYLKFFGDRCIGIKLRKYDSGDQKLEFKPVFKNNVNVKLPDGISGKVEQWEKWSTGAIAGKELLEMLKYQHADWHALRKDRWLRKYSADKKKIEKINAKDENLRPENGCNVELTELRIGNVDEISETNLEGGKPFWTLGFEAFNDEDIVVNVLAEVVRMELLENQCPSEIYDHLASETTDSYPSWFAKFR